jgi:hypothetical protein
VSFALWIFHLEHLEKSVGDKLVVNCFVAEEEEEEEEKRF